MATLGKTDVKLELKSEARRAVLRADPTEVPRLVLMGVSGASQYVMAGLGLLGLLLIDSYFLTVTDRSIYVHRGPRLKNRPEKLVHVIPRAEAAGLVARVRRGKTWNVLHLQFPGDRRPTRLNVSYHSRDELERFLNDFPEGASRGWRVAGGGWRVAGGGWRVAGGGCGRPVRCGPGRPVVPVDTERRLMSPCSSTG